MQIRLSQILHLDLLLMIDQERNVQCVWLAIKNLLAI